MAANGFQPRTCSPTAVAIICCSAIYDWMNRSGSSVANSSVYVLLPTSPSTATTSPRALPRARSASPKALRVASFVPGSYDGSVRAVVGKRWGSPVISGLATSTVMSRMPPSSAIAASGSASGFPCMPGWLATAFTPWPFSVRAMMTVGRPVVPMARSKARSMASMSCPSITIAFQPNAFARRR